MRAKLRVLPYVVLLLPLDFLVAFGLMVAVVFGLFKRRLGNRGRLPNSEVQESAKRHMPHSTVVIVNWDGRHLLAECLPSVIETARCAGGEHDILVVDNGSTDGSAEFVRQNFPTVRILTLDRNYGFSEGNNRGAACAVSNFVVLLNNDMIVDRDFLRPLLSSFSDPSVFAVTSQIFFEDTARRREETGKTRARFRDGAFYLWHDDISPADEQRETIPVFWAGGGSCAIDRDKFLEIGGFDSLYYPFYVEDTDLSYQAWKRGWKCAIAPTSHVVHKHRSTSSTKFGDDFVNNTIRRNQYLFIWKNVTDLSMILEHLVNLPRTHARAMINDLKPSFEVRAYVRAIRQLPNALRRRLANQAAYSVSDREVLVRSQKQ
jgi:O-antigen biosynthesis protein